MERELLRLPIESKQARDEIENRPYRVLVMGHLWLCLTFVLVENGLHGGALRLRRTGS